MPHYLSQFHLAVLNDSRVEMAPKANSPSIRNVELSHSEMPQFGRPRVQLSLASATTGGANTLPTAYVICYRFSDATP
jgi:hypothetical protein